MSAMIVKTIATDHQLEIRKNSPTRPTSITEKSYLRSQFERRQKRRIELTNKMNQQQLRQQSHQPDSAVRSHELIKRRFFEKLERRESISAARGAIKPNEFEQVGRLHHQQQQQLLQPIFANMAENRDAGGVWPAKVDAVNEADGAGTDADEAASLETIITNNCKSNGTFAAAAPPNLCEVAAQARPPPPPSDDSRINDEQQVDESESTSAEVDHERHRVGQSRVDHGDVSSGLFKLQEAAKFEQATVGLSPEQQKRQPSKRDLRDGLPMPLDAAAEDEHERLRLVRFEQHQREQYANPRSRLADNSQGSHENDVQSANNANHDQPDGPRGDLASALSSQVFSGMQFGDGAKGERRINLIDRSLSGEYGLIEPLRHEADLEMNPGGAQNQEEPQNASDRGHKTNCDMVERRAIMVSSPIERIALEEDVGSSCSSSGFGASVSAGSSSASSSDGHHQHELHHHLSTDDKESISARGCGQNDHYRRPGSARYETNGARYCDNLQSKSEIEMGEHEIAQFEIVVGRQDGAGSTGPCKNSLSVGPDQAYQEKGGRSLLHVENYGYGSLVNASRSTVMTTGPTMRNQTDKRRWPLVNAGDVSSELDLYSNRQYVNLPAAANLDIQDSSSAVVGYATVRAQPLVQNLRSHTAGSANMPSTGNNGHSESLASHDGHSQQLQSAAAKLDFHHSLVETRSEPPEDCGSSLSEHNSSTSSANTGGFSKLPPVRLIDHHFANNFQSSKAPFKLEPKSPPPPSSPMEESNSMQQQSKKSPSLLKRFGSLVSRAFTSSNSASGGGGGGSNFGCHYGNNSQVAPADGSRLEVNHSTSASAVAPLSLHLKQRRDSHEFRNDTIQEPSGEHKSMENDVGLSKRDYDIQPSKSTDNANRDQQSQSPGMLETSVARSKTRIMAQADLVILTSKRSRNNQVALRAKNHPAANKDNVHHAYGASFCRDLNELSKNLRLRRPDDKLSARVKQGLRAATIDSRKITTHSKTSGVHPSRRSTSGSPCSSLTSLDNSSVTSSSSTRDLTHRGFLSNRKRLQRTLRRTSSLSDELESLMSRSEVESPQLTEVDQLDAVAAAGGKFLSDKKCAELSQRRRSIATDKNYDKESPKERVRAPVDMPKSRSIMRWFNATSSASSSPTPLATNSRDDCHSIRYDPTGWTGETRDSRIRRDEPRSLIDQSHASSDCKVNCVTTARTLRVKNSKLSKRSGKGIIEAREQQQPTSLVLTSLSRPSRLLYSDNEMKQSWRKRTDADDEAGFAPDSREDELVVNDGKCQSLNLYQNLLRNYVKRRNSHHHRHHHHHHHHGHHNRGHHHHAHSHHHGHHHNKHSSSSRHAHCSSSTATATTTRCGRTGSPNCACSYSSERLAVGNGKTHGDRASVWGQLIKINKSDGSQVIELQRAPGRSWGFFVARGAINNKKGIFISRMHDSSTGSSLSGLLSIGDQILSIDNYTIEPDFDILRVNQMISKKSKISLGVKPFKG